MRSTPHSLALHTALGFPSRDITSAGSPPQLCFLIGVSASLSQPGDRFRVFPGNSFASKVEEGWGWNCILGLPAQRVHIQNEGSESESLEGCPFPDIKKVNFYTDWAFILVFVIGLPG